MGKVVFATAAGDIHDIGKDIIVFMLDVNSFEVCNNNECLNYSRRKAPITYSITVPPST
ncbi:MAG: hypothetical protein MUP49_06955 [Dehalococcoidia bacterium]|nr:hypothetical protein [Dehalococcoidia bacterium]